MAPRRDEYTPNAFSTPFDKDNRPDLNFVSESVQEAIEELGDKITGTSGNVTTMFVFSKGGGLSVNSYLYSGQTVSSISGPIIRGNNKIIQIYASNRSNVTNATTLQLQKRTAVNTYTDIVGATVTIPAGSYRGVSSTLSIAIGPNEELSAYNKSGDTLLDVVLTGFTAPV